MSRDDKLNQLAAQLKSKVDFMAWHKDPTNSGAFGSSLKAKFWVIVNHTDWVTIQERVDGVAVTLITFYVDGLYGLVRRKVLNVDEHIAIVIDLLSKL